MCVIFACEDKFPKIDELESAELMNPHGAGIGWVNNNKEVEFKKGLKAVEISKMIESGKINLPCVIHFRIGTSGGISKGLTHPFQICKDTDLSLSGVGKNLLFHNGIYPDWQNKLMKTLIRTGVKLPKGAWSDSRFMALLSAYHGQNILELFEDQKIAILTPKGIERFGDSWPEVDGITCSNDYFNRTYTTFDTGYNRSAVGFIKDDFDSWSDEEQTKMRQYGKHIEKLTLKLRNLQKKIKQPKKSKRYRSKISKQIDKLESQAVVLTNEREDFIQSSETINYDYDEYRSAWKQNNAYGY